MALAVVACEIPFDLDQEASPKLYAQCIVDDGIVLLTPHYATAVNASVSAAGQLSGLQLGVLVNGQAREMLLHQAHGYYFSVGERLKAGDQVELTLEADGVEPVKGTTQVPPAPQILEWSARSVQVDTIQATELRFLLDHAPLEGEFYGIRIAVHSAITRLDGTVDELDTYLTPGYILTAAQSGQFDLEDFLQVNYDGTTLGGSSYQPITLLTQKQFDGAEYRFYLDSYDATMLDSIRERMPDGETGVAGGGIVSGDVGPGSTSGGDPPDPGKIPVAIRLEYHFTLSRLSPAFYYYARALFQSNFDFLSNMGLTPANFTYSNLSGGLGVVGALSSSTVGPLEVVKEIVK